MAKIMSNIKIKNLVIGAMVFSIAVSCVFYFFSFNFKKVEIVDNSRIDRLFNSTKILCIGRFVIEVPESAAVIYGPAEIPFPLDVYKNKASLVDDILRDRLAEVEKEKDYAEGRLLNSDAIIGRVIAGELPGQKLVFGVSQASGVFYRIQSYLPLGDDLFVQEVESIGTKEEYEKNVQRLNSMARLLRSRNDFEIPQTPGICVESGFVIDPPETMREYVTLGIRFAEFPDVHFSMSTTAKKKLHASDALEPRINEGEQNARAQGHGAWYSRIRTLRRGARELGKWKGFEVLAHLPAQATEGESHEFNFVSQGEPMNPLLPLLELELRSGVKGNHVGGAKPSISDGEAVLLWDKLTNSIRIRPTATNPNEVR